MRLFFLLSLLSVIALNCGKQNSGTDYPVNPPRLATISTTSGTVLIVSNTFVTLGGNVTNDGGAPVTARGICWGESPAPTVSGNQTQNGTGTGTFTGQMQGLTPGVLYFTRAYATNSVGTAYSNEISFTTTPSGPGGGDIYAVGNLNYGINSNPTLWKNGIPAQLTIGSNPAQANSVSVFGSEVFVAGYERNGSIDMARVWRNGAGTFLTNSSNGSGIARSVYMAGSDVYVAGESRMNGNNVATLWRNGNATILSAGAAQAGANSVFVSGGVFVYAAGYEGNVAKLWKDGVATSLSDGTNIAEAYWVSVFLPDVYVAGTEMIGSKPAAKIWKNNVGVFLTNGNFNAAAFSVYIANTDVYVAGYESNGIKNVAKVWKNGVAISLTDGTNSAIAYSVYGSGSDYYVGGFENDGTKNVPKLWKNGLEILLQNATTAGYVSGVFVK